MENPERKIKEKTGKQNVSRKLFPNPMGVISIFISVISVILAIYFYYVAQENRELCFYVNPTKTNIVKSGQTSGLSVSFKEKTITSDVTAIQVVIWNRGRKSIQRNNILTPIIIDTNGVPILEAKVINESRKSIAGTKLDTSNSEEGKIGISWNIIEEDDGCVIQLICSGGIDTDVRLEGIIEGQKRLISIDSVPKKSKREYVTSLSTYLISGSLCILFVIFLIYSVITEGFSTTTRKEIISVYVQVTLVVVLLIILAINLLILAMKIQPPLPI